MESEKSTVPVPGIKVLVVDGNVTSLGVTSKMLQFLGYQVIISTLGRQALKILNTNEIHLVIMELDLYDIKSYELVELIAKQYDIPSFVVTANQDQDLICKALWSGAKLCLRKPLQIPDLSRLWQFAMCRRKDGTRPFEHCLIKRGDEEKEKAKEVVADKGKRREERVEKEPPLKRRRTITWSHDLHNKFLEAFNLAGNQATPKRIHQLMNSPEVTAQNVAGYLRKHRKLLKQCAGPVPHNKHEGSSHSNLGSQSQPPKGLINLKPVEVHENSAHFPTLQILRANDSAFLENQLNLQVMAQQKIANGGSSGSSEKFTAQGRDQPVGSLVPVNLCSVESTGNGNTLNDGATLVGMDYTTTTTTNEPYLGACDQPFESDKVPSMNYTTNDMSQQIPPQLPVQPSIQSHEKEFGAFDAEFGETDDFFDFSEETGRIFKDLGAW